jgi:hypothetical protein
MLALGLQARASRPSEIFRRDGSVSAFSFRSCAHWKREHRCFESEAEATL